MLNYQDIMVPKFLNRYQNEEQKLNLAQYTFHSNQEDFHSYATSHQIDVSFSFVKYVLVLTHLILLLPDYGK